MKLVIDISEGDYDWIRRWAKDGTQVPVYDTLARYITSGKVLSEEQERKTGKWEVYTNGFANILRCTAEDCGASINITEVGHLRYYKKNFRYCPFCGAKMEADE